MSEFVARSVEFEGDCVAALAVEHRAPGRMVTALLLSLIFLRLFARNLLLSGVSLTGVATAVVVLYAGLIAYWIGAPRRRVELDTRRRQLRVVTRGLLRRTEEITFDFYDVRHCVVRAMGPDLWLWNLDTSHQSLTLCALRDEYDAKRLQGLVAGLFGAETPRPSGAR